MFTTPTGKAAPRRPVLRPGALWPPATFCVRRYIQEILSAEISRPRSAFEHESFCCSRCFGMARFRPRHAPSGGAGARRRRAALGAVFGGRGTSSAGRTGPATHPGDGRPRDPHRVHRAARGPEPGKPGPLRRALDLCEHRPDRTGPGTGPARVRRAGRRFRAAPLRVVLLFEFAPVYRPGRGPIRAARHRRIHDHGCRARAPDHPRSRALQDLGRNLRPPRAQFRRPHRAPDAGRGRHAGTLDLGPPAGARARVLHGLRARRSDLGPSRLSRARRARHSLGGRQGRSLR